MNKINRMLSNVLDYAWKYGLYFIIAPIYYVLQMSFFLIIASFFWTMTLGCCIIETIVHIAHPVRIKEIWGQSIAHIFADLAIIHYEILINCGFKEDE